MGYGGRKYLTPSTGLNFLFQSTCLLPVTKASVWDVSSPHLYEALQAPTYMSFSMMSQVIPFPSLNRSSSSC